MAKPDDTLGLVFTTANTPHDKEVALFGDPLETHWLKVVFGLCGVRQTKRWDFSPMIVSTDAQREAWLKKTPAFVPHQRIADQALALGLGKVIPTGPGDDGLMGGLMQYFESHGNPHSN